MKRTIFLFSFAIFTATSCQKETVSNDVTQSGQSLKNIPAKFSAESNNFAFDFWKQLNKDEKKDKSYFVSPLSLNIALGMLVNGANGTTKAEIEKMLGLGSNQEQNNQIYKNLMENLPKADPKVKNTIANSVWHRKDFAVEPAFITNLKDYFMAAVYAEDFKNTATVGKINQWAANNTNDKIKKVLEQIEDNHVMFLLNALYFKGDWKTPFNPKSTYESDFTNIDGTVSQVQLMNSNEKFAYTKRDKYHAVRLPYGSGNYNMTVMMPLPDTNFTTDNLIQNMNLTEWGKVNEAMTEQKILLGLPKFKIEYEKILNNSLDALGMQQAFTGAADFSKISPPAGKLKVGFVKQNTFVAVDEVGTEAAAVTTIGIELTSAPLYPEFFANKPFVFVISEKNSNTILFVGKVVKM